MPSSRPPAKNIKLDVRALGGHVVSVHRVSAAVEWVLLALPSEAFSAEDLRAAARAELIEAARRDLARLRKSAPELADSALAASAVAMALEVENPFNSATAKSMCQARLTEALRELRDLAPPEKEQDGLTDIEEQRAKRRARLAAAADQAHS